MRAEKEEKMYKKQAKKKTEKAVEKQQSDQDEMISFQKMSQIMTKFENIKFEMNSSNDKLRKENKKISDCQKCSVIDIEAHKKVIQMKLQQEKKWVQFLKTIPIQQDENPQQMLEKEQELIEQQERKIREQLILFEYLNMKQAQFEYQEAMVKQLSAYFQTREEESRQEDRQLSQQLQRKLQQMELLGEQIIMMQYECKEVYEEKKDENNELQDLKGNIRVYCRLRPALYDRIEYQITDNLIRLKRDKTELKNKNRVDEYEYLFQKIFRQDTPQNVVFQQLSELVQCSVDGKNVCIFAYGQTGSGKTHTMSGVLNENHEQMKGFIPRSIEYIFDQVQIAKSNGYQAKISVFIFEVYNDKIFDLLSPSFQKEGSDSKRSGSQSKSSKINSNKVTHHHEKSLQELTQAIVKNPTQALLLMLKALKRRTTAQTKMNTSSSRSHLIFEIRNQFSNSRTQIQRASSLVLVDLAGSERQKDSGVTGIRLEEAKSINNSLTELGKVMRAIKDEQRPSFRNCQLTMILQKYLESDSKAVMFVNVSPDKKDLDQTINSLVFAQSVRQCKIKNNSKNIKPTSTV